MGIGGVIMAVVLGVYFSGLYTKLAGAVGQSFSPADCYTAAATSTLTYMTIGTATTTVTCGLGLNGASSATLLVMVNASSTNTTLNIYAEESLDGQDWFPISQDQTASTSAPFTMAVRQYSTLVFASSTISGSAGVVANGIGLSGTNNRNHYQIDVPVKMKRVRAYTVVPVPSTYGTGLTGTTTYNGAVWMQIVPRSDI